MARYIDADLIRYDEDIPGVFTASKTRINNMPTADVRENVRGRWVEYPDCLKYDGAIMQEDFVCSECKAVFSAVDNEGERFNYCPNCGADMRGEV